ncbi:MAG: SDR family oxidoreductase [Bacteroidales bacterium]|jgi:short-subunit dehydrogenase|nr:SDR family oxidoreductase [Bacteroidales bacterium]
MENEKKIIWITGASSGIGEEMAYRWSKENCFLILSARRENELRRVQINCAHPEQCVIFPMDLANPQEVEHTADKVLSEFGSVDILVHNGGISQRSSVADTIIEVDRKIMEIDYFSSVILTKKMLPVMLAKKKGHIVVVSSIAGLFGFPMRSAYSAAKHAMHGFYETLWAENHKQGIDVTIVCPGRILTNVSLHALTKDGTPHGEMDHGQANGITAEQCAKRIVKAVKKRKKEIYIGRKEIGMVYIKRYLPYLYYKLVSTIKPT